MVIARSMAKLFDRVKSVISRHIKNACNFFQKIITLSIPEKKSEIKQKQEDLNKEKNLLEEIEKLKQENVYLRSKLAKREEEFGRK